MENSAFSDQTYPITFLENGQTYENARIRYRGAWARGWPKKPLKVFFAKDHRFHGQRCIDLNSGWRDPAFIREILAYEMFARCGAPASTSRVVQVNFNGRFRGIYLEIEQPDKPLLARYGLKGAALYKATSHQNWADERDLGPESAFTSHYEKETDKTASFRDLQQFCHELATTSNVRKFFEKHVDLPKYINYLAATVLVQNWDGFNKNHFIVHDLKGSGKWFPVPWDLDRTFGDHWNESFNEATLPVLLGTENVPGITGWNRLQDRFFSDRALTAQFLARLNELLRTEFTPEKLYPFLDQLESTLRDELPSDYQQWPRYSSDLHNGIIQVKKFIERRREFLAREISRLQQSR